MPDEPMPDQDVKLGTAADESATQPVDPKTNSTRYYYRPGTTEPELRPEFANEAAAEPEEEQDLESKTKAELLEMAEDKGVDAKQSMNKADIIELLEGAE